MAHPLFMWVVGICKFMGNFCVSLQGYLQSFPWCKYVFYWPLLGLGGGGYAISWKDFCISMEEAYNPSNWG